MSLKYIRNEDGHFVCPNCNIIKEKQNTMYYHMLKHEGKLPYECSICKKDFLQKAALDVHMASKHRDKNTEDKQTYKCCIKNCKFSAVTKANRRIHVIRKHFKTELEQIIEENNTCNRCNKNFKSTTSFYYHAVDCILSLLKAEIVGSTTVQTKDGAKQQILNAIL